MPSPTVSALGELRPHVTRQSQVRGTYLPRRVPLHPPVLVRTVRRRATGVTTRLPVGTRPSP